MTQLDKIIKELCPDGVDYYYLGDIGKFYGGLTGKSKDDFKDGFIIIQKGKKVFLKVMFE